MIWIEEDQNIEKVSNNDMVAKIAWSKNVSEDFLKLATDYFESGYLTLKEIIDNERHDNVKYDMWFLPAVYLLRQSLELVLKSGLAREIKHNQTLQCTFIENKHNLKDMFETFCNLTNNNFLTIDETEWIEDYINSIEQVDSGSDLFRYPFKDEFMSQYGNDYLDVVHMSNRLMYAFSILHKLIYGSWYSDIELNGNEESKFICLVKSGMFNCDLWDSAWGDGFHKQIIGYSEVAEFLYENYKKTKDITVFYPMVFLLRNAIEIGLKRLLHINTEVRVDTKRIITKRNSHLLHKDLWKSVLPIVTHYAEKTGNDINTIDLAESYIISIKHLDKNGDKFRYPCGYNLQYYFDDREFDVENVFTYMTALFKFIDSCQSWLSYIQDIENEIRSEWLSEMRSYEDVW